MVTSAWFRCTVIAWTTADEHRAILSEAEIRPFPGVRELISFDLWRKQGSTDQFRIGQRLSDYGKPIPSVWAKPDL